MRKLLLASVVLTLTFNVTAQITVIDTDFPSSNDTAMVSSSDETTLDLVTTGANASWDFSFVNISTQRIDTFHSVASADFLFQAVFNNFFFYPDHLSDYYTPVLAGGLGQASQFGVAIESPTQFTAVLSDKVQNTGIGVYLNGFGIPAASDTIDVQYELPMDYSDSWTSNSFTELDLNPAFNGIYRRHQQRNSVVDGWGEITTPFGTFQALRVKSFVTGSDSVYVDFLSTWLELPTPDQIEYDWIATGQKVPVFSVVTADVGGNEIITTIEFKDKKRDFVSVENISVDAAIYPNPTNDQLIVVSLDLLSQVDVFDIAGKKIFSVIPTTNQVMIDLSNCEKGMYVIQLTQNGNVTNSKIMVQ